MQRKIAITGSNGFIGKNLCLSLNEDDIGYVKIPKFCTVQEITPYLDDVDIVIHLAGVNRSQDNEDFEVNNVLSTEILLQAFSLLNMTPSVIFSSSTHASANTPYGTSKRKCERLLENYKKQSQVNCVSMRLPNIFGKWSRPNHNSVVATFCHNMVNDEPLVIHDPDVVLTLSYIDDLTCYIKEAIRYLRNDESFNKELTTYQISVGELADRIETFGRSRKTSMPGPVGSGLNRALYATYLSFLPVSRFSYKISESKDERGRFSEVLRTSDSGQFSFFTTQPGAVRGNHYHHTKSEKFVVVRGVAEFQFKNVLTGQSHSIITSSEAAVVVETVPGWAHSVSNIGSEELVVMLWSNETFDPQHPDTYHAELES